MYLHAASHIWCWWRGIRYNWNAYPYCSTRSSCYRTTVRAVEGSPNGLSSGKTSPAQGCFRGLDERVEGSVCGVGEDICVTDREGDKAAGPHTTLHEHVSPLQRHRRRYRMTLTCMTLAPQLHSPGSQPVQQ